MKIVKQDIASISNINEDEVGMLTNNLNKRIGDVNPQATRHFYAPSAHQLKKGEVYYQNAYLIYNSVSYGFTDHITAGASLTIFGAGATCKVGFNTGNFSVSAGGIEINTFDLFGNDLIGIGFVNTTIGNERKNFSITYGRAFAGNDAINLLNIAGMLEINSHMWIMTENYIFIDDDYQIFSLGIRRASSGRDVLWDYAMAMHSDVGDAPIPWISATIPF